MKRIAIIIAAVCIILGGRLMPAAAAGENSQVPVAYTEGDYKYVETDSGAAIVDCRTWRRTGRRDPRLRVRLLRRADIGDDTERSQEHRPGRVYGLSGA